MAQQHGDSRVDMALIAYRSWSRSWRLTPGKATPFIEPLLPVCGIDVAVGLWQADAAVAALNLFTIMVTGTSGVTQHSARVNLIVQ